VQGSPPEGDWGIAKDKAFDLLAEIPITLVTHLVAQNQIIASKRYWDYMFGTLEGAFALTE
jgi:hypothetical protein